MSEKDFEVVPAPFNLYKVQVQGGGEVPKVLKQRFTDPQTALNAIKQYKSTRRDYPARGRVKNAKQKPEHKPADRESSVSQ